MISTPRLFVIVAAGIIAFGLFVQPIQDAKSASLGEEVHLRVRRLLEARSPNGKMGDSDTLRLLAGKCGFRLAAEVAVLWPRMSGFNRREMLPLIDPPLLQKNKVLGRFRIYFDTTNINGNEPALLDGSGNRVPNSWNAYVDSVGKFFNEVWERQVSDLGYERPPFEQGQGSYNVYIDNLGPSIYGFTQPFPPSDPINPGQYPPRYSSYIVVHNDFRPFFSKGMDGLKVTAAHEFHHAIQLGGYGLRDTDLFLYEITSTWMEDVVYDDVNDYYQYIRSSNGSPRGHFATPHRSLNATDGFIEYGRAIWGKFIEKRFGISTMKRTWEHLRSVGALQAIDMAAREVGSSLRESLVEFSLWNQYTSVRADSARYYSEARNYPLIKFRRDSLTFQTPISIFPEPQGTEALGSVYLKIYFGLGESQSLVAIISNLDMGRAGNGQSFAFQYLVRSDDPGTPDFSKLTIENRDYWARIDGVTSIGDWRAIHVVNKDLVWQNVQEVLVYPNPFLPPEHTWIRFQVPRGGGQPVGLYVYSSSMELVYFGDQFINQSGFGFPYVSWDGRSQEGIPVSSGIYFYVVNSGTQVFNGKFSVLRK